jgi:hypothetical protein
MRHSAWPARSVRSRRQDCRYSWACCQVSGLGALSLAGMPLTTPAIVALSVSAARLDAAQPDKSDSTTASPSATGAPGLDEDAGTSVGDGPVASVVWGLAAGAGFAVFLIGLNRAGSAKDLWPVGIADIAEL